MKRIALLTASALAAAALVAAALAFVLVRRELAERVLVGTDEPVMLDVAPGETPAQIARRLEEAGIVRSARLLLALARWRGADRAFRFGRHEFEGSLSAGDVLRELERTPKPVLRVTIPEGLTWREIGALLEAAGATSAADYQAAVCSEDFLREAGALKTANCAEGFLFPDTYDLVPGMSARRIAQIQLRRFRAVAAPLAAALGPTAHEPTGRGDAQDSPARLSRALTIASIIEKETAVVAERQLVAAVIYNRLRLGMPLQVDPTVIYGVIASGRPWDGNLTRGHLETPTPYNTYLRRERPPGPICNPGVASLRAALAPADASYLYFVARGGDGSHEFNASLADHNRAVRRFQIR
ncbi:MAG: endolytic transglycosylase MltG [Deltaproteobacteria bacterium]|nr:endolytic transglycosylase MltG [Deltaproteobacteria bacterium]